MFPLAFRIPETSQRPLHPIAQPWNLNQTFLMHTAIWHIAFRLLPFLYLSFLSMCTRLSLLAATFSNLLYSCHSRSCVTGQITMNEWRNLWPLWLTSWKRTGCPRCTHTTACSTHCRTASARPLQNAMETFVWIRYTQWWKQVTF